MSNCRLWLKRRTETKLRSKALSVGHISANHLDNLTAAITSNPLHSILIDVGANKTLSCVVSTFKTRKVADFG